MNTFFLLFGVFTFSWYLTKFIFWIDTPGETKNKGEFKNGL